MVLHIIFKPETIVVGFDPFFKRLENLQSVKLATPANVVIGTLGVSPFMLQASYIPLGEADDKMEKLLKGKECWLLR